MMCGQPLLRLFAPRHITGNHDYIDNLSLFIPDDASLRFDVADSSVACQNPVFRPLPCAGRDRIAKDTLHALSVLGMNFGKRIRAPQRSWIAEEWLVGRTVEHTSAVQIEHRDQVLNARGDSPKQLVLLPQLFLD